MRIDILLLLVIKCVYFCISFNLFVENNWKINEKLFLKIIRFYKHNDRNVININLKKKCIVFKT